MPTCRHFVAAALCLAATCAASADLPVKITTFASDKPAVPSLTGSAGTPTAFPGSRGPALIMTSFKPFAHDTVTVVPDVGAAVSNGSVSASLLEDVTVWPNMANMVPYDEFKCAAVLIAGGFLVPGKSVGSIDVFTPEAEQDSQTFDAHSWTRHRITTDKKGWFYHKAIFVDMDGDGRNDILTARATKPTLPWQKTSSELLWLERPKAGSDPLSSGPWIEHLLYSDGPGVGFTFEDVDGDGKREVIATEYFAKQRLAIYTCSAPYFGSCGPSSNTPLNVTVIDNTDGAFFSVQVVDLDADGTKDLLATNNKADGTGCVFAFAGSRRQHRSEDDALQVTFTKHIIAGPGYKPKGFGPGLGGPGSATAFHPFLKPIRDHKPSIVVSGDDAGYTDLLVPSSSEPWVYNVTTISQGTGTMGSPAVGDINGDGAVELIVPYYKDSKVDVFSYGK